MTKPAWGGKGLLDLYFHAQFVTEESREELKQEPGEGMEAQTGEMLLTSLLPG